MRFFPNVADGGEIGPIQTPKDYPLAAIGWPGRVCAENRFYFCVNDLAIRSIQLIFLVHPASPAPSRIVNTHPTNW